MTTDADDADAGSRWAGILWTGLAAVGAILLALLIAPFVGRAGAALAGAVVIAVIGTARGLRLALLAAIVIFLGYSFFIGERRLPGEFLPTRHVPQLTLFLLVALIAGTTASRLRAQLVETHRLDRGLHAMTEAARRLAGATSAADAITRVRLAGIDADLRLFLVDGTALREIAPLAADDAGRAAEAAEIAWLTGSQLHRMAGIAAFAIEAGGEVIAVLVASRRGAARVPVAVAEGIAQLLRLVLTGTRPDGGGGR